MFNPMQLISYSKLMKSKHENLQRLARSLGLQDDGTHEELADRVWDKLCQPREKTDKQRQAYIKGWDIL